LTGTINQAFSGARILKNQKIKVSMYTPLFLPYYGGTEMATYYLAKELMSYCDVKVHTFDWVPPLDESKNYGFNLSSKLPKKEIVEGVCVVRYPFTNLPIVKNFSVEMIKDLSFSNSDIVHFQGFHRLLSRWLLQKAVKKKIKILTTHAIHESVEILSQNTKFWVKPFFVDSTRTMDHIIALSKFDLKLLLNLGIPRDRITIIPNGIDPKKFEKRRNFVERNGKLKILCVARFAQNKNYESLIYVLSKLKDHLDVEAYFVGNPDDYKYFKKIVYLVKKNGLEKVVKIAVSLDDPALIDCYLSCDLFVLPSRMETFPLVILEAMYAGLPVVATDVGGIPEIIEHEVNGFIVPSNSPEELHRKCLLLLQNKNLRDRIGTANRETAEKYTWSKMARSTFNLYHRLLEKHNS